MEQTDFQLELANTNHQEEEVIGSQGEDERWRTVNGTFYTLSVEENEDIKLARLFVI